MNGKNCAMPHYRCQGDGHQGDSTSSLPAAGALCTAACGHGTPPSLCSTTTYIRTLWHGVGLTPKYGFVSPCPPAVWPSPSCCWALATPRASCCLTSAPRKTGLRGKWYEGNEGGGGDDKNERLMIIWGNRKSQLRKRRSVLQRCGKAQMCCSKQQQKHQRTSGLQFKGEFFLLRVGTDFVSPWFRYVSVSSCSLTAGDVAAHSTYWNGGFLVSFSGGRLVFSCLKMGRANTSLRETRKHTNEHVDGQKTQNRRIEARLRP